MQVPWDETQGIEANTFDQELRLNLNYNFIQSNIGLNKYNMKYYIINHRDNKMEGYQCSLDRSDNNFNSMMTMIMMPKDSLECSISYFNFTF